MYHPQFFELQITLNIVMPYVIMIHTYVSHDTQPFLIHKRKSCRGLANTIT